MPHASAAPDITRQELRCEVWGNMRANHKLTSANGLKLQTRLEELRSALGITSAQANFAITMRGKLQLRE